MKYRIPFIVSCVFFSCHASLSESFLDDNAERVKYLRDNLLPSCRPPSWSAIASDCMKRFAVSEEILRMDLLRIASNTEEEPFMRLDVFMQYARLSDNADIFDLPFYSDETLDSSLRRGFIGRAFHGIEPVEAKVAFAKSLLPAQENSQKLNGDQMRTRYYFESYLNSKNVSTEDAEKVYSLFREEISTSTNIVTIWMGDDLLCGHVPDYKYGETRIKAFPQWLALTNQVPNHLSDNCCRYFSESARDLEFHLKKQNNLSGDNRSFPIGTR